MPDYKKLSTDIKDDTLKQIFTIIAKREPEGVADSIQDIPMTADDAQKIQELMLDKVRGNMVLDSGYTTLAEARKSVAIDMGKMVADSFFNPVNGIGTMADPGYYNDATIPVSMSPNEATAYYANGGIAGRIIDAKSQGLLVNGYRFLSPSWEPKDLDKLKEHADGVGLDKTLIEAVRDGLVYGGSFLVPHFKKDNSVSYGMTIEQLIKAKILVKDSLSRFWEADRWNAVMVPDYDISAADYLTPRNIFVPITGKTVNTERASIIRPKQLPYWGTLRQMGWGISDMEGWIKSLLGYEMCIASIPIMAQQMSVMYRHIPLDGIIAQNGPAAAEKLAQDMSRQMVSMSNIAPKTFNVVGEIKVIDRSFAGFPELVNILEEAVGAKADLASSIIFHKQASGLNASNSSDTSMKMAGTIQNIGNTIIPQLQNIVRVLVASCFGPDSEQYKSCDTVRIDFDSPVVLTNEERNAAGTTFAATFSAFITGGLQPADAIEMSKSFCPDIEIPQSVIDKLNAMPELMDETASPMGDLATRLIGSPTERLTNRLKDAPVDQLAARIIAPKKTFLDRLKTSPIGKIFGGMKNV